MRYFWYSPEAKRIGKEHSQRDGEQYICAFVKTPNGIKEFTEENFSEKSAFEDACLVYSGNSPELSYKV